MKSWIVAVVTLKGQVLLSRPIAEYHHSTSHFTWLSRTVIAVIFEDSNNSIAALNRCWGYLACIEEAGIRKTTSLSWVASHTLMKECLWHSQSFLLACHVLSCSVISCHVMYWMSNSAFMSTASNINFIVWAFWFRTHSRCIVHHRYRHLSLK